MSDTRIQLQVLDQLLWDNRIDAGDVGVTVKDGRVTMKGFVNSFKAKTAALWDAYLVQDVTFVDNQLKVQNTQVMTDIALQKAVGTALKWDFDLDDSNITVTADDGVVRLTGTTTSYWEKYLAEDDAYRVGGVTDVRNELGIVMTGAWSDERVAKDIESAMGRNFSMNVEDVDVLVEDGIVTLRGTVPSWAARYAAYECARYTSGVFEVNNEITIAYG